MEFIFEEIEVKTDSVHDPHPNTHPNLKNENMKPMRDTNENAESSDPYFKFKLLVEELLIIFTKREEKCGICVEYIVKLCQHIGDTHDSGHEHDKTDSNSSDRNSEDSYTSHPAVSGINSSRAETSREKSSSQSIGCIEDVVDGNGVRYSSKRVESYTTSPYSKTPPTVKKNKVKQSKRDLKGNSLNRFSCGICGKDYRYRYMLKRHHLLTHAGEKPFECETCGKRFTTKHSLKDHNHVHTGQRPYKCDICDKSFRYASSLSIHKQKQQGKCKGNDNNTKVIVNSHMCLTCNKIFRDRYTLNAHSAIHGGKHLRFYCGVCGKGFFYNYMLANHRLTHTGEKQVYCEVCGKYFPYSSLLFKHRLSHTGENRFNCNMCRKSYLYKYGLDKHKLTHTGEKRHNTFDSRDFKSHMSGNKYKIEKPQIMNTKYPVKSKHKCLKCGKVFTTMRGLRIHRAVHTKKLKCEVCDKHFRHVGYFMRHMRTHNQ